MLFLGNITRLKITSVKNYSYELKWWDTVQLYQLLMLILLKLCYAMLSTVTQ
jgi:hypothetical protein